MTSNREAIWELYDRVKAGNLPADPDFLADVQRTLSDHRIEIYERPSAAPRVAGNIGASPEQLATQEAFFSRKYRIIGAGGANQSGKTECIGGMCVAKHIRDYAQNGDVFWCIAQSHDTLRDIPQKTLWKFLPRSMFPDSLEYSPKLGFGQIPTLHLTLPDGRGKCELWFKTEEMDLKSFESSRVNGIWWTECRREAVFYAIQPRLAARKGWLAMDYVPVEAWHKFVVQEPAESGSNPNIFFQRFGMIHNAHNLPEGTIEYTLGILSDEEAAVRVYGEDAAAFGVVYKQFDPKRHVIPAMQFPAEFPRWRTMDYGYRNPTACLWLVAVPRGFQLSNGYVCEHDSCVVYRELYATERTVKQNADAIRQRSDGEVYQGPVIIDPTATNITQANGKSIAQEFFEAGLPVRPGLRVNVYGNQAMVENVRRMFAHNRLFFSDECPQAIREHRSWRYKENKDHIPNPNDAFEKKDDHTCDALKLLIAENPSPRGGEDLEPVDMELV